MGGSSKYNRSHVDTYYRTHQNVVHADSRSVEKVYKSDFLDSMIPSKTKLPREACDSPSCPHSRAVAIFYDTTSSMNIFLMDLVKTQMKKIPVDLPNAVSSYNPQILFGGVNDIRGRWGTKYPLQIGQFEAGFNEMIDQLTSIHIEGGGSGNGSESYILAHYFAARYTRLESFEKRGKKGFLFIVGDDGPTPDLTPSEIIHTFGKADPEFSGTLTAEDVLEMAEKKFHVYQIVVHGSTYNKNSDDIMNRWKSLMGSHALDLSDYRCISSLIITIMRMYNGKTKSEAINMLSNSYEKKIISEALADHEETVADDSLPVDSSEIEEF